MDTTILPNEADVLEMSRGLGPPEISILMPVFEQAEHVRAAVLSVLAQRGVVAEIIISDDSSADGTYSAVHEGIKEALLSKTVPHRVVLRRGRQRLWRDHLPLLVEMAQSDIVCQAHGDDLAHADRARKIVEVFRQFPHCSMVASAYEVIPAHASGELGQKLLVPSITERQVICGHPNLLGCNMAWRRSRMLGFTRLDTAFSPVSHDRILAFRALLSGSILLLEQSLVQRREHAKQAHRLSFDEPDPTGMFGWSIMGLVHLFAMKRDLATACAAGLVNPQQQQALASTLDDVIAAVNYDIVESYGTHTRNGLHIAWIDRATMISRRGVV